MSPREAKIFVKVECSDAREIEPPAAMLPDERLVHPEGRISGRQSEHNAGLGSNASGDQLGSFFA